MVGRGATPALHHPLLRYGIKRRVDLYQVEVLRIPLKSLARGHLFWIPAFYETRIRPARCADQNSSSFDFIGRFSFRHASTKSHEAVTQIASKIRLTFVR